MLMKLIFTMSLVYLLPYTLQVDNNSHEFLVHVVCFFLGGGLLGFNYKNVK